METTNREIILQSWRQFYRREIDERGRAAALVYANLAVDTLLGRMAAIRHKGARIYLGYDVPEILRLLSQAVGVHQQAVLGLTSAPGEG